MKEQACGRAADTKKAAAIGALYAVSVAITLLGLAFCVYSTVNHVEFMVMKSRIPGAAFGLLAAFLGARYFLAVKKLKKEVYKETSRFSWSNFKKQRQ